MADRKESHRYKNPIRTKIGFGCPLKDVLLARQDIPKRRWGSETGLVNRLVETNQETYAGFVTHDGRRPIIPGSGNTSRETKSPFRDRSGGGIRCGSLAPVPKLASESSCGKTITNPVVVAGRGNARNGSILQEPPVRENMQRGRTQYPC